MTAMKVSPIEAILDAFDFARVARIFAAQGWKYGLDIPMLGMTEHVPDAAELRKAGQELLTHVMTSEHADPYCESGRLRAEYLDGRLRLCCTGELAAKLGTDEPRKADPCAR